MGTPLSILIVEDSASDAGLMVRELQKEGFDVVHERVETAALALLRESAIDLPFILVSGTIGEVGAQGTIYVSGGKPAIVGMAQDITEKRRAEKEVQHLSAQLNPRSCTPWR